MDSPILTIGIASYNRVSELKRCLESIDSTRINEIEVLVSEDKSPNRELIKAVVEDFAKYSSYSVVLNLNEHNLGYDRNLKQIITLASGKYVMFMSDDDALIPNALDKILAQIENHEYGLVYSPFVLPFEQEYRRCYKDSQEFAGGVDYISKHVYDAILFSGLTFLKDAVKDIDAEPFLNLIYFQVYLFLYCGYKYGGLYSNIPLINCIGDGENGFGLSESSEKNELLVNRKSALSNLEYHKGLIKVIKKFDVDYGTEIFCDFEKEYQIRTIVGLCNVLENEPEHFVQYWEKLNTLDVEVGFIPKTYYIMLKVFGVKNTKTILELPRNLLKSIRHEE